MFSTGQSPLFSSIRRPERRPWYTRADMGTRQRSSQDSDFAANVNRTLSMLNPNHGISTADSPLTPVSFVSAFSQRTAPSIAMSMSSSSSVRSFISTRSEVPARHLHEPSPKIIKPRTKSRFNPKAFLFSSNSSRESFASGSSSIPTPDDDAILQTPRPSFDSTSSSGSVHSWKKHGNDRKKSPFHVPPPLHLTESNFHDDSAIIDIGAESYAEPTVVRPMRVRPRPPSPTSPEFVPPSEEEQRRRRYRKVMQTLGEDVPPELVYRGGTRPILNVNVFPDPPSPETEAVSRAQKEKEKVVRLARRASFTLTSMTASLLPSGHARSKSRDLLDGEGPPTPKPQRKQRPPAIDIKPVARIPINPPPRPESMVLTPMIFSEPTAVPDDVKIAAAEDEDDNVTATSHDQEAKRAERLARRASISTSVVLPSSPLRDRIVDVTAPLSPSASQSPMFDHTSIPSSSTPSRLQDDVPRDESETSPEVYLDAKARPESLMLSPIVFSKPRASLYPSQLPSIRLVMDEDEEEAADKSSVRSRTPTLSKGSRSASKESLPLSQRNASNPSLPLFPRPDTPFSDSAIPLPPRADLLAPPEVPFAGLVSRRERRQGWSGEWNRPDMQDVIQKLRALK